MWRLDGANLLQIPDQKWKDKEISNLEYVTVKDEGRTPLKSWPDEEWYLHSAQVCNPQCRFAAKHQGRFATQVSA